MSLAIEAESFDCESSGVAVDYLPDVAFPLLIGSLVDVDEPAGGEVESDPAAGA